MTCEPARVQTAQPLLRQSHCVAQQPQSSCPSHTSVGFGSTQEGLLFRQAGFTDFHYPQHKSQRKRILCDCDQSPGIGSLSGSHAFPGKWNGLNPTQTESVGVLVPQGKLGCCYKQKENRQTLIRQARKTPQGSSSLAWKWRGILSGKLLPSANLMEADGAPGDQDGGGRRRLSWRMRSMK